jgi:ParB family chromosome partitioning protein
MNHKAHESLLALLVPLDSLQPLENNPRVGNVDAIAASYNEFGQVKPIVIRENTDGKATVIAGNHQVQAAKKLGWTHIAAVPLDADNERAIAFALTDNRTMELGHTDHTKAVDMIVAVVDQYDDLMSDLQWDDFEIALYQEQAEGQSDKDGGSSTFFPPEMIIEEDENGERRIVAGDDVNHEDIVLQGSTVTPQGVAPQAVVQYTLVFDNPEQQKRWYQFVRWLRSAPAYDGGTTAEKVMAFLDAHSEV